MELMGVAYAQDQAMTRMRPHQPHSTLARQTAVIPVLRMAETGLSHTFRSPTAAEGLRGSLAPGLHSSNPGTQTAPRAVSGPDKGQTEDDCVRARTCGGDESPGKRCREETLFIPMPPGTNGDLRNTRSW